jgi:hypothetical protein
LFEDGDGYLRALIDSRGGDDKVVDLEVKKVLFWLRLQQALLPWFTLARSTAQLGRLAWEKTGGRYWKSDQKNNGSAGQTSGGGAGAGGFTAASVGTFNIPTASPAPTIEDAGIRAGEITAYRCWRLGANGLLYSMIMRECVWKPGQIMEGDVERYGIHGFKSLLAVGGYGYSQHEIIVSGTIEMWGTVVEHERGYRSSKAAVASIDDSPDYDAKALRKTYGLVKRRKKKK